MKKVLAFLRWHWNSWDWTQRIWMLGAGFFGAGISDYWHTKEPGLALKIALSCWALVFVKWICWDAVRASWKRFENERKDLFTTIDKGH